MLKPNLFLSQGSFETEWRCRPRAWIPSDVMYAHSVCFSSLMVCVRAWAWVSCIAQFETGTQLLWRWQEASCHLSSCAAPYLSSLLCKGQEGLVIGNPVGVPMPLWDLLADISDWIFVCHKPLEESREAWSCSQFAEQDLAIEKVGRRKSSSCCVCHMLSFG